MAKDTIRNGGDLNRTIEEANEILRSTKITLNVDEVGFLEKPEGNNIIGGIVNRLGKGTKTLSVYKLMQYVERGCSFTPAEMTGTIAGSWKSQQIIIADVDNKEPQRDEKGNEVKATDGKTVKKLVDNPLSSEDALRICKENGITPAFMYHSFSNSPELERFRVVCVLDQPVDSAAEGSELTNRLAELLDRDHTGALDLSMDDPNQIIFGSTKGSVFCVGGALTSIEALRALPQSSKPVKSSVTVNLISRAADEFLMPSNTALEYIEQYRSASWLKDWFRKYEIPTLRTVERGDGTMIYAVVCPWGDKHSEDTGARQSAVIIRPNGQLGYVCQHAHCKDRSWKEYRAFYEKSDETSGGDEAEKAVLSAFNRDKGSISRVSFAELVTYTDNNGQTKLRQCAENVYRVLELDPELSGKIKYDTFNYRIMYLGQLPWKEEGDNFGTWQEADDAELRNLLDMKYGLNVKTHYDDGFKIAVSRNKYNPLTGFLDALKWDGIHRIDTLLPEYLGADRNEYTSGVMHTFLQGMMHRAFDPGSKFDYMLILLGRQGAGKSTFLKYLACRDDWYSEDFNFRATDSKSTIELMEGKWLLEMGEMATLKKDAVSSDNIKAFITSQSDKYRVPYEKRSENRKRQCVFAGTSNDINFLKDRTGGRRFLPVLIHPERIIKDIRDEKAARPEFEQVIAEAVHYYKEHPDEKPMLPDELTEYAEEMQKNHLEEDGWVALIQEYLDGTTRNRVNSACIWVNAFNKEEPDMKRADSTRILTIMRNDIEGWQEVGKARCDGFGRSLICFDREGAEGDEELSGTGFEQVSEDTLMPY